MFKKKLKTNSLTELIEKIDSEEIKVMYLEHNTVIGANNKSWLIKELMC